MNTYFIIAGVIGVLGSFAHTILGHIFTVAPLDPEKIASTQFTGDQNKRFLMWFWHIGSVVLFSTTIPVLLQGLNLVTFTRELLMYISLQWLLITAIFFVIAIKPPTQVLKMVPGLVGIPVNLFILLGLFA